MCTGDLETDDTVHKAPQFDFKTIVEIGGFKKRTEALKKTSFSSLL